MRRLVLSAVALALAVVGSTIAGVALFDGDGDAGTAPREARPERCAGLSPEAARDCYAREFRALVGDAHPASAVADISTMAWRHGGFLLSNCHGIMHTVGRTYALERGVTLARLMDYLPPSNDPGCAAGFAHGLVTGAAPSIDPRQPRAAASICADSPTRYQRYSCTHGFGHAFMRLNGGRLEHALELCAALGDPAPDCAQGAFHDYWFAVVGADDATLPEAPVTDPRELCGVQPEQFVRPCWYRAYVDNRPQGIVVDSADHVRVLCEGLAGLQRAACVTAASVIGPPDPALQLALCADLADAGDAEACVRGTKVQNLLASPPETWVELIGDCDRFAAAESRRGCYRWLGKVLAVISDGAFEQEGCPQLMEPDARRECSAGARSLEEPLVTFS